MKKLFYVFVAFVAISFAACGNNSGNNGGNTKENNDNKNGGKNEKEAEEFDSDKSTNDKDIINNSKNRKMKLLRVYPKVREIMETNKQLTEISLHNKLNVGF